MLTRTMTGPGYFERISAGSTTAVAHDLGPATRRAAAAITTTFIGGPRPDAAPTTPAPAQTADPHAQEMWEAYMESAPMPHAHLYRGPKAAPREERVVNPYYSEVTESYTSVTGDTLYFGVAALVNWRVNPDK